MDQRPPAAPVPAHASAEQDWPTWKVSTRRKPRSMKRHEESAEGDNRANATKQYPGTTRRPDAAGPSFGRRHLELHFADLHDRLDIRVVRNVRHDLRRVGRERRLKCVHRV